MNTTTPNPKTSRKAKEMMRNAINSFYDHHGLLGFSIARVKQVEDYGFSTIGINDKELRYNPAFIADQSANDVNFIIVHEGAHVFLGHPIRFARIKMEFEQRYGRPLTEQEYEGLHTLMNMAADLALNQLIQKMSGVPAPSEKIKAGACFVGYGPFKDFEADKSMEFYFRKLYKDQQDKQQQQDKSNEQNQEQQDGEEQDEQKNESKECGSAGQEGKEEGREPADADGSRVPSAGVCGGAPSDCSEREVEGGPIPGEGSTGSGERGGEVGGDDNGECGPCGESSKSDIDSSVLARIAEALADQPIAAGEIMPATCANEEELEAAEQAWQDSICSAVVAAKSQGFTPGWLSSLADAILPKSIIDWRTKLRRFFQKSCREGYSYKRPSRRHSWRRDCILPARLGKTVEKGVMILDVSGSMSQPEFFAGLAEVERIITTLPGNTEVTVIQVDVRKCDEKTYSKQDFPITGEVERRGFGGTDLSGVMREVSERKGEFKYCLMLTDGYWSYQDVEDIHIPTMWLFTNEAHKNKPPQFGEVATIKV